jgi:hypothetical protein
VCAPTKGGVTKLLARSLEGIRYWQNRVSFCPWEASASIAPLTLERLLGGVAPNFKIVFDLLETL